MNTVAIGLGANLGNREENLQRAGERLSEFMKELRFSSVYETEPVGYHDQPWFLNQVCLGVTEYSPLNLLFRLKNVEKEMGREPGPRFGPRLIDLDLLFYRDWIIISHLLTIPHPRMMERSFVIQPLLEIITDWVEPKTGRRLSEVWAENKERFSRSFLFRPENSSGDDGIISTI